VLQALDYPGVVLESLWDHYSMVQETCLSQGSGLPEGPCAWQCPQAVPSFVPYNFQLTPLTKVTLSILESGCG
jgi:hypothetical protein